MGVTTLQEDIAYSLFGIFSVHLPAIYGEKKQNALGRLLQEIAAQSGDITTLDCVGKSSDFDSCLPADITSYEAPPCIPLSLSDDEMQKSVYLLQRAGAVKLASTSHNILEPLSAARFAHHRLHLHYLAFPVTEVRWVPSQCQETCFTCEVKANELHNLVIATEHRLMPSSRAMAARQPFLLVRPWDRDLLELSDSGYDEQSMADFSVSASGIHGEHVSGDLKYHSQGSRLLDRLRQAFGGFSDSESHSQALRLIVRLRQPFRAFLLVQ